jgi:hypothetical protein
VLFDLCRPGVKPFGTRHQPVPDLA